MSGSADATPDRPLAGVRVLDFTRILSGPYCTLLLADLGAEVIKVERPDSGDDTRAWGPPFLTDDTSAYFAALNRDKRSLAIDLSRPGATPLLHRLLRSVDVVVENFRPGVTERLGLDYPTLATANPRIVVCSISGYGRGNGYAEYAGTEIVVEAMSGLMSVTGNPGGDPVRMGVAMVDIATGLTAATRINAALLEAHHSGRGSHIDCSLYSTAMAVLGTLITSYSVTGQEPRRWGSHHPSIVPYGGFPTADGHIITGVVNDRTWPRFCEALGLQALADRADLKTNAQRVAARDEVESTIGERTRQRNTDHWLAELRARRLLAAPIRSVGQAVHDPATQELGLFTVLDSGQGALSPRLDGRPAKPVAASVPALGSDSVSVVEELLGLGDREIGRLVAEGVLGVPGGGSGTQAAAGPQPSERSSHGLS
jgi:crotonobetainyl-CoA:carnitine CoA-transferase CaiB-like acyl-CoA transferase